MSAAPQEDLVVLVADKNIEHVFKGLLDRHHALAIRSISRTILVHMHHDPGCLQAAEFLRSRQGISTHALVVFDREGSGAEASRVEIEAQVETDLSKTGWGDRAAVIVLDPEIECWVWSPSPHVDEALGWKGRKPPLREWLKQQGHLAESQQKPSRPKEALEAATRAARVARSSSIYEKIAKQVSFGTCQDPSFLKLRQVLSRWFGA